MKTQANLICSKNEFHVLLDHERMRSDRHGLSFSVAVFGLNKKKLVNELAQSLKPNIRLTDKLGWFDKNSVGVLLDNTTEDGAQFFINKVKADTRVVKTINGCKVYTYPNHWFKDSAGIEESVNYSQNNESQPAASGANELAKQQDLDIFQEIQLLLPFGKRAIDILGASVGLLLLSPLFLLLSIYIKLVSPGPVFFKQERVGYGGKLFTFWKFRTMHVNNDTAEHQQLLTDLINGSKADKPMKKLDCKDTNRLIPYANFLRATCIDELPQLINVFLGEMSLVGPRPPIPYEVNEYHCWHKGRFAALPGMTGLWQVSGKNKLTFKEMVRLDIQYARKQSLLLDIKILLSTPLVIVSQLKEAVLG